MRILTFFITSLLAILFLAVLVAVVAREALLWWGVSTVQSSLSDIEFASRHEEPYVSQCKAKGSLTDREVIDHFQLRFLSSTQYVVEVVCNQFPQDPIVMSQKTLPPFVQKDPGSAGIIWGDDRSGVVVGLFGRKTAVIVEKSTVSNGSDKADLGQVTPVTTCTGYGYSCCQSDTVAGTGKQYAAVTDCPRSCFSACTPRPVVLSFASDPFPDAQTRSIQVRAGESVTFSYVVSTPQKESLTVTLDYGDGTQDHFSTLTGQPSHQYACLQSTCQYVAKISVLDAKQLTAANTPLTMIKVMVSP